MEEAELDWISGDPFSKTYQDFYFSKNKAISECNFIYLEGNQLLKRWSNLERDYVFNIGELGFGTGINFLVTLQKWKGIKTPTNWLNYFSIEKNPIPFEDLLKVYKKYKDVYKISIPLIDKFPINCRGFHRIDFPKERASLTLAYGEVNECLKNIKVKDLSFDAWFLDGFSPQKNPEIWNDEVFNLIADLSCEGSSFSTFSSAKIVKDNLKKNNFSFSKPKGFSNKRHMLKGKYISYKKINKSTLNKRIGIIGAGISGCSLANLLSTKGYRVSLFEKEEDLNSKSLFNTSLVLYPRLSVGNDAYAEYCLQSYLFSTKFFEEIGKPFWNKTGVLLLDFNQQTKKRFKTLISLRKDSRIFRKVTASEASKLSGIKLKKGGLFFPDAGWLDLKGVCSFMLEDPNVNLVLNNRINSIKKEKREYEVTSNNSKYRFDHICLCTSFETDQLLAVKGLSKKRGQTSVVENKILDDLKIPICANGYLSPSLKNTNVIGSTYSKVKNKNLSIKEHEENVKKIKDITTSKLNIVSGHVGFRATTKDHLPLVGNANGIFLNIGHGSRGSTSAPFSSQFISDLISKSPPIFSSKLRKAVNPERFKFKD